MSDYTPTMAELKDYATSYSAIASEAEWDRALAAHDAAKRAGWEAEQGGHVVPCARCGQRKVVASDAINSDMEVCGRCGTEIALHELAEQGETEWEYRTLLDGGDPCPHGRLTRGEITPEEWFATRFDAGRHITLERRRKTGPWEPVPDTGAES